LLTCTGDFKGDLGFFTSLTRMMPAAVDPPPEGIVLGSEKGLESLEVDSKVIQTLDNVQTVKETNEISKKEVGVFPVVTTSASSANPVLKKSWVRADTKHLFTQ